MESGPLSHKDFPEFAEQVVPFLHITTHIPGHPYDNLLSEFGFDGFPSLAFLDAEGNKLADYDGPRTVKGFEQGYEQVQEFIELQRKAADGDAKAATDLLIRQLELGWHDIDEARKRADALTKVSSSQRKQLDQLLVDTEVRCLAEEAGEDRAKRLAAGERFHEIWKDKQIPSTNDGRYAFWMLLADHAEQEKDKQLMAKVIEAFDDTLPNTAGKRGAIRKLEERLDAL